MAYGTELVTLEGLHQTVHVGAIDALGFIAATFKHADGVFIFLFTRRGHRCLLVQHILPLHIEIDHGGDVGFPRLDVVVVEVAVTGGVVVIFVGETREAMAELMDDDITRETVAA